MISHKYKFIFIHTPKTAGNSIQNHLRNYSEDKIVIDKRQAAYNTESKSYLNRFKVISSDKKFKTFKHTTLNSFGG